VPDPEVLIKLLYRWRHEAVKAGATIKRIGNDARKPTGWISLS
jgi:hypothetical protein